MKKLIYIILVFGLIIANSSCKKDDPKPTTGTVNVNLSKFSSSSPEYASIIIAAGESLSGTKIEIHSKATYDAKVQSVNYNGASVSFPSLPLGKYYVMAWKDKDNDNTFSPGDFFGFVEKAVMISGGENFNFNIQMYVLKN